MGSTGSRVIIAKRLTFANVTSLLALFVALSGSSYAAFALPANSVGRKQIKRGAVTKSKLARGSVTASKVVPGSLTGADINLSTLGKVPSAARADSASTANSAPIAKLQIVKATGTNQPGFSAISFASATATCPSGTYALGGGAQVSDQVDQGVNDAYPSGNNAWTADVFNTGGGTPTFYVYAVCGPAASTG